MMSRKSVQSYRSEMVIDLQHQHGANGSDAIDIGLLDFKFLQNAELRNLVHGRPFLKSKKFIDRVYYELRIYPNGLLRYSSVA